MLRCLSYLPRFLPVLLALFCLAPEARVARSAPARPNVILFLTDDQGYADISVNGCSDYQTPHLDSLAKNGVRCAAGYVCQPQCSPSRAGLLTGRHPSRFGHEENPPGEAVPRYGLPPSEKTLADHLTAAGYLTAHFGKWHLGAHATHDPRQRGFAESLSVEATFAGPEEQQAFQRSRRTLFGQPGKYAGLSRSGKPERTPKYVADALADEVVRFIERPHDRPFFLYWAHPFPHVPQIAEERYLQRVAHIPDEKRRVYASMMLAVDEGVGRMLEALRRKGLEENTLIVYASDNGGPADGRLPCSNGVFRGSKGGMFEGGIRVPYFVQWKGRLPAGKVYERPVSTLDVLPTVLAAAGARPPAAPGLDGVDLLPYLTGEATGEPHDRLYWRYLRRGLFALREGDWKLMKERDKNGRPMLFDLKNDPGETTDLAGRHPERLQAMRAAYDAWARDLLEPLWMNRPQEVR
jgi:arylsulfatase A-like enzyme